MSRFCLSLNNALSTRYDKPYSVTTTGVFGTGQDFIKRKSSEEWGTYSITSKNLNVKFTFLKQGLGFNVDHWGISWEFDENWVNQDGISGFRILELISEFLSTITPGNETALSENFFYMVSSGKLTYPTLNASWLNKRLETNAAEDGVDGSIQFLRNGFHLKNDFEKYMFLNWKLSQRNVPGTSMEYWAKFLKNMEFVWELPCVEKISTQETPNEPINGDLTAKKAHYIASAEVIKRIEAEILEAAHSGGFGHLSHSAQPAAVKRHFISKGFQVEDIGQRTFISWKNQSASSELK